MDTQYGAVAMVFRTGAVGDGTFMSPLDSGGWEIACNQSWGDETCTFHTNRPGCERVDGPHAPGYRCRWSNSTSACERRPPGPGHHHHGGWGFDGNCTALPNRPVGASLGTMRHWHHVLVENSDFHTSFRAADGSTANVSLADRLATLYR